MKDHQRTFRTVAPEKASIEVTVGDKKAKIDNVTFYGLPYVDSFLHHYGWSDMPSVTRIGDSVMIAGGMRGAYARDSKYWDDIQLKINDGLVPIKSVQSVLNPDGYILFDAKDFGEIKLRYRSRRLGCPGDEFRIFNRRHRKKIRPKELAGHQWLPHESAYCVDCAATQQNGR